MLHASVAAFLLTGDKWIVLLTKKSDSHWGDFMIIYRYGKRWGQIVP